MPGFDRSKFKPTPMAELKKQDSEHETKRPSGGGDRVGYLAVKPGDNKFRFFPCHPEGGGKTYSEAKCVTFLSVERQAYDDNNKPIEGKKEFKRTPIFNSKVHGDLPIDLVEEYLKVAKNKAIPAYTDDQKHRDRIWAHLTGMNGVKPGDSWVVYASKFEGGAWSPVGILELKKSIKTQLQDLAIEFVGNDPVSPDPFTDPDQGIAVIINKTGEGLKTEYKVSLEKRRNGMNMEFIPTPLTDEQLEAFSKLEPLYKTYVKSFKRSDLESQIEGLMNFEQELASKELKDKEGTLFRANIGVFQYDEFQTAMDQLLDLVPESATEPDAVSDEAEGEGEEEMAGEHEEEIKEPVKLAKPVAAPKKIATPVAATPAPKKEVEVAAPAPSSAAVSAAQKMAEIRNRLGKK